MLVQICVGSSCHLKGSEKIVELFKKAVSDNNLSNDVTLAGSFCSGKCNREGVTVAVDNKIYTGITPDNFDTFFNDKILEVIKSGKD